MAQVWCYIGRETRAERKNPIETVVCATVDRPERTKDNAKLIAKWMRDGLAIERVPVEWVRLHFLTTEPYRASEPSP